MKTIIVTIISLLLFNKSVFAEDHHQSTHEQHESEEEHHNHEVHHDHGTSKAIGPGKAILKVDEVKGFKLSQQAFNTLEIKLKKINTNEFYISKNTLVASKNFKGVYRYRSGFFKLLKAKIIRVKNSGYLVSVESVHPGDEIVVNGLGLLRVADIYSTDKSEYGHGH